MTEEEQIRLLEDELARANEQASGMIREWKKADEQRQQAIDALRRLGDQIARYNEDESDQALTWLGESVDAALVKFEEPL